MVKVLVSSDGVSRNMTFEFKRVGDQLTVWIGGTLGDKFVHTLTKPWIGVWLDGGLWYTGEVDGHTHKIFTDTADVYQADTQAELVGDPCPAAYFISQARVLGFTEYQGVMPGETNYSSHLAAYNTAKNKEFILSVSFDKDPVHITDAGTIKPATKPHSAATQSWEAGVESQRMFCENDGHWYWVGWNAALTEVAAPVVAVPPVEPALETPLEKEWREFFDEPNVVDALGLVPSSVQESFSRVFDGYSIIHKDMREPRPGDYAAVYLILGGLTLAAATGVYVAISAIPSVGAGGMMKGSALIGKHLTKAEIIKASTQLAQVAGVTKLATVLQTMVSSPAFKLATLAGIWAIALWNLTDPMWWYGVMVKMSGDAKKRFESLRIDLGKKIQQAYGLIYIKSDATKKASALVLLRETKPLILDMYELLTDPEIDKELKDLYPEFEDSVRAAAVQYNDLITAAGGVPGDYVTIEELLVSPPALPPSFPEEIIVVDVDVEDGDTIHWPGHPEANSLVRFVGIDAHESGTTAGIEETEYLKSLIQGQQVILKVDPYDQLGAHGRLLAVPFLGDQNIIIAMLNQFGKDILTPTKYHDRHKFIDWDELKRIAAAATGAGVKEFKINIDSLPSRAKLYIDGVYTHHLTPSDGKELKDVMALLEPGEHVFRATKGGEVAEVNATIVAGVNSDIMLVLQRPGLEEVPAAEAAMPPSLVPPAAPEPFNISVISTPLRAKLYIDGVYTHHLTPSDAKELSDVMHLLTPGVHVFRATKTGKVAEVSVDVKAGYNEPVVLVLLTEGLPVSVEDVENEIALLEEQLASKRAELEALKG